MTTTPAVGWLTSRYGKRKPPLKADGTYGTAFHRGVDIGGPEGTPIVAPLAGDCFVNSSSLRGLYVIVDHGRFRTLHQHLRSAHVGTGQRVNEGQQVGVMGTSGGVARHLHTEVHDGVNTIDPMLWYAERGVSLGQPTVTVVVLPDHQTDTQEDDEMFDADKMLRMAYTEDLGRPASDPEIYPRLRRILEAPDPRKALAQEINGIDASTESNRHEVHEIYQRRVGRHGSVTEWDGWIASVGGREGVDLNAAELAKIDAGIAGSVEGKAYAAKKS
jgi:hypothetical protein